MREITGLILAGGQGRRMGGVDKGLAALRGRPMVAWVLERLAPQVGELLINANQNLEQYRDFGYPVVTDEIGGFAGPLAGLQAGMKAAHHAFVLMVPCDSPFLPADLAQRLFSALNADHADLAVAKTGGQPYPVFALARTALLPQLTAFLEGGRRTVYAWYDLIKVVEVAFDDQEQAFTNINTTDELKSIESSESPVSPT
ncbi:MAG: molybdenum cofactor guanylyltransferase MobA [Betaproteobacteria bacterium RIFCSPLOWO2_12_FULL_65_110]|nr:MAG: molybdenum cofactor guanylyltransferase MobA [Betaproteobacteria bacterium RIFCSPLOWO2_12_FULL_65_110]